MFHRNIHFILFSYFRIFSYSFLLGFHPNAEIKFLRNQAEYLFDEIFILESESWDLNHESEKKNSENDRRNSDLIPVLFIPPPQSKEIIEEYLKKCPKPFNLVDLELRSRGIPGEGNPLRAIVMQECVLMNVLILCVSTHLDELLRGLAGGQSMSVHMDELLQCIGEEMDRYHP